VVLAVFGGVLALLCVGAVGLGLVLYREETRPDRSSPSLAADSYLRALLVERDDARADVFSCRDQRQLADITSFANDIEARERELGASIAVNLEDTQLVESREGSATVSIAIRRTAALDGTRQSLVDRWRLLLVRDDGWRVCGAERLS
jgi:hypothetical protein